MDQPLLSPADAESLEDVFSYHAPTPTQVVIYDRLRRSAKDLARTILELCPPSADRTAALRHVREAVFTANASVALEGRGLR